jgi:hypothetical protein
MKSAARTQEYDAGRAREGVGSDGGGTDRREAGSLGERAGSSQERAGSAPPSAEELIPGFTPQTTLEREVAADPELRAGLAWGRPRPGHPEGSVAAHVADLLRTIDGWGFTGARRAELRLLALVHDSFKNQVQEWRPKTGANHHATRAKQFLARFTTDPRLLYTLEHHDRPYALWRKMQRKGHLDEKAFTAMLDQIPDPELFLRFIELDGSTEGKKPAPVDWFRDELRRRGIAG